MKVVGEGLCKSLNRQGIDVLLMGKRLEVHDLVLSRQIVDFGMRSERGFRGSVISLGMVIVGGVEILDHVLDRLRVVVGEVYDFGG